MVVCGGGERKISPHPPHLQHTCCRGAAEQQDVCVGGCDFFAPVLQCWTPRTCAAFFHVSLSESWSEYRFRRLSCFISKGCFHVRISAADEERNNKVDILPFMFSQLTTEEDEALRGLFILRPETLQHFVLYFSDVFLSNVYTF